MCPNVISESKAMFEACECQRRGGKRVGFVPTMGGLHDGHLALVDLARQVSDFTVVSIFVNPTQFGPREDFAAYPRDLEADLEKLRDRRVDAVFSPTVVEMYPEGFDTEIAVGGLTEPLCGAHRPGHFNGVTTVVAKLFCAVGPSTAVFGRKDYQQLKVIQKLVRDLNLPVQIVSAPTVREPDGLAMSSRNVYLSPEQRTRALSLSRGLRRAHAVFAGGERRAGVLREAVVAEVSDPVDSVDYIEIADPEILVSLGANDIIEERALIAVAVRVGATRLIDNTVLGEDESP